MRVAASTTPLGLQQCIRGGLVDWSVLPVCSVLPLKRHSSAFRPAEPLRHLRPGTLVNRSRIRMASSYESARIPPTEPLAPPPHGLEKVVHQSFLQIYSSVGPMPPNLLYHLETRDSIKFLEHHSHKHVGEFRPFVWKH
jgi:hypothetical protein